MSEPTWGESVGRREEPVPLGKQLAAIMASPVQDKATLERITEWYEACEMQAHMSKTPMPDDILDKVLEDSRERNAEEGIVLDAEEEAAKRDLMKMFFKTLETDDNTSLELPEYPLPYRQVLALAVHLNRFHDKRLTTGVELIEEKIAAEEAKDPIGFPTTEAREANSVGDFQIEAGESRRRGKNLTALQNAITTLTEEPESQAAEAVFEQAKENHTARMEALKILVQAPAILGEQIAHEAEGVARYDEREDPGHGRERAVGMRDALIELKNALAPMVEKAQGELKGMK